MEEFQELLAAYNDALKREEKAQSYKAFCLARCDVEEARIELTDYLMQRMGYSINSIGQYYINERSGKGKKK